MQSNTENTATTSNKKLCDSGYSNSSNSNSNSQRSASSKSRHSESCNSSGSSGYGGASKSDVQPTNNVELQTQKHKKDKEHKKKHKTTGVTTTLTPTTKTTTTTNNNEISKNSKTVLTEDNDVTMMCVDALPNIIENITTGVENALEVGNDLQTKSKDEAALPCLDNKPLPSWNEPKPPLAQNLVKIADDTFTKSSKSLPLQPEDGFYCVISMCDGIILYTTSNLTKVLGFPKDMWLGRSFIDFIHPKDRETFSSQIAAGIALPLLYSQGKCKDVKHFVYVLLRKYKGLKSNGYGVVDKPVTYQTFKLTITIRYQNDGNDFNYHLDNTTSSGIFLVIVASPVYSAYKVCDEVVNMEKFGMRHTAACVLSHVDPDVVSNLGFLPQDMLGKSIFDFYHPEDMLFLKETYESITTVCQIAGTVFKSKPYRFAVQNGGFVMIETEWSSFVNPWSKRLEFVIGLNRVLKGPKNPDVFAEHNDDEIKYISDDVLKESKLMQRKILLLLNKELSLPINNEQNQVIKHCKDVANIVEILIDDINNKNDIHLDIPQDFHPTISVSWKETERGSVMLGEISPHHDFYDSKSSSETPPSYNQLNYNENIERFFQSKPITTISDESSERTNGNLQSNCDTDQEGKVSSVQDSLNNHQNSHSPLETSGDSGSGSGGNLSSMSNPNMESITTGITASATTNVSNDSHKPPQLTEAVLSKHNADMEKIMIQRHKEQRSHTKDKEGRKSHHHKADKNKIEMVEMDKFEPPNQNHGVKRCISNSWDEDDTNRITKSKYKSKKGAKQSRKNNLNNEKNNFDQQNSTNPIINNQRLNDGNLWPPFSVSVTHNMNTTTTPNFGGFVNGMFPFYYIPSSTQQKTTNDEEMPEILQQNPYQVQYVSGVIYNTMIPASPLFSVPILPVPMAPMMTTSSLNTNDHQSLYLQIPKNESFKISDDNEEINKSKLSKTKFPGPASQATSVKAEPGSALGSVASASVVNKAMSECSQKDLAFQSVCSQDSPLPISPPDEETNMENYNTPKANETNKKNETNPNNHRGSTTFDDDSLFSSSYSSFLKTDGSGSNDDSTKPSQSDENSAVKQSKQKLRKKEPPWMESVSATPEIIYRYQMSMRGLEDILESDLKTLRNINQPMLVNDQLNQLYIEMELEGLSSKLTLEEELTTSSNSSNEENTINVSSNKLKKKKSHSSYMMFCDENAPLPSPDS